MALGIAAGSAAGSGWSPVEAEVLPCEEDVCETAIILGFDGGATWCRAAEGSSAGCDSNRGSCTTYACGEARPRRGGDQDPTIHPLPDALPPEEGSRLEARDDPPPEWEPGMAARWRSMRDAIVGASPDGEIPLAVGPAGAPHAVVDVELTEGGMAYVLEALPSRAATTQISAHGPARSRVVGVESRIPGERQHAPLALFVLEEGRLGVAHDMGSVTAVWPTEDGFGVAEVYEPETYVMDACGSGDAVFAVERNAVPPLAQVAPRRRRGFGIAYEHGSRLARHALSEGSLACLEDPNRVVFGFRHLPRLDAYDASGEHLWTAGVDDYEQGWFVERMPPQHEITTPVNYPRDRLVRLMPVGDGFLLAVYQRSHAEGRTDAFTYLVDAETGRGARIGDGSAIIAAARGDAYVALAAGADPRLTRYRMDLPPE